MSACQLTHNCEEDKVIEISFGVITIDQVHIDRHPIKPKAWDKICEPKCDDGLGIKKIEDLNATYLVKQC